MPEPFLERLSRFTPDAGGLDRDALLFAAGRGSARPNRGWIALAAALAITQALTLALWWLRPDPPVALVPPTPAPLPVSPAPQEPPSSDSSENPGLWSARPSWLLSEPGDRPASASTGTFIESGPPLRAFGSPLPSMLN